MYPEAAVILIIVCGFLFFYFLVKMIHNDEPFEKRMRYSQGVVIMFALVGMIAAAMASHVIDLQKRAEGKCPELEQIQEPVYRIK